MMKTLVLDCRWMGHAGVGRATELLIRGLREGRREARWILWGPRAAAELAPDLDLIQDDADPRRWFGQAGIHRVPRRGASVVFMHQTRPLVSPPCVTVIHDTTQLRTPTSRSGARARRAFLKRSAATSSGLITVSEWSRQRIVDDLGVAEERIRVVGNPTDRAFGERVRDLREKTGREQVALFVGSFAPHKNLPRLISSFQQTEFFRSGGRLVLVGGRPREAAQLRAALTSPRVSVVERCAQEDLDSLYASALMVVQPSLEEGFGLPVWEAMAAGIPVCCSTGGALASIGADAVASFDPLSERAMAAALDRASEAARRRGVTEERQASRAFLATRPGPADHAREMERAVLDLLERRHAEA